MNLSWYLFYGRRLGMQRQEILVTRFGEMCDMISCLSIYEGNALPKTNNTFTDYEEAMKLR